MSTRIPLGLKFIVGLVIGLVAAGIPATLFYQQNTSLQSQYNALAAKDNSTITSLQSHVSTLQGQVSTFQGQVTSLQNQITSQKNEITSLQDQVTSLQGLLNLGVSTTVASQITINEEAFSETVVISFNASYAGYLVVTGTSTSNFTYLRVTGSFTGYPYNKYEYPFGTRATFYIPILPGTVTIYLGNHNYVGVTATLSIMYYS